MEIYQIAIDGPSGSGKSTLAKGVAKKLGIMYLDTGAMYRTCALASILENVSPKDEVAVAALLSKTKIEVIFEDSVQHMLINGVDYTDKIRTPEVSIAASDISALPIVREKMVEMQRQIASNQTFVLDGRDIGSNVLPNAKYKFFLTADARKRAERRLLELNSKGDYSQSLEEVLADIEYRDKQDSERSNAPLVQVADAIGIDTSNISIEQTLEALLSHLN